MSDIEDTTGRLRMSGRYEICRDRITRLYAVVAPNDRVVGWYDKLADARDCAAWHNGKDQ